RLECANSQARKRRFDAIYGARAFADKFFTLAIWSLGVFFFDRWNSRHTAMASLSSQPAKKGPHQQLCVETIGLHTTVLTRHSDTACQPKPITSCFIGDDDALR